MRLNEKERVVVAVLGALALVGLGINLWFSRRPAILVEPGSPPPYAEWDAKLAQAKTIDLNRATAEELERLPGIGPVMAKRIVDYRAAHGAFQAAEELRQVSGIGPKTYDALADSITVRSEADAANH